MRVQVIEIGKKNVFRIFFDGIWNIVRSAVRFTKPSVPKKAVAKASPPRKKSWWRRFCEGVTTVAKMVVAVGTAILIGVKVVCAFGVKAAVCACAAKVAAPVTAAA